MCIFISSPMFAVCPWDWDVMCSAVQLCRRPGLHYKQGQGPDPGCWHWPQCQCCQDASRVLTPGPRHTSGICAASAGHGVRETRAGRYQRWARSGNTETELRLRLSQWLRDMWDGHHQWPEWHESKVSQTRVNKVGEEETVTTCDPCEMSNRKTMRTRWLNIFLCVENSCLARLSVETLELSS